MKVLINSKEVETEASILSQLIDELSLPVQDIAVAAGNRMVLHTEWTSYVLSEGISIVVMEAVCGG